MDIYDFHTHTFLSDGGLSPVELIRRAHVKGYRVIAVTDHGSAATMERVIAEVALDCEMASRTWGITALCGIELTHVPAAGVAELARKARLMGARIVGVHGETPVEPVEPGTNRAAILSPDVDFLAHPGLISDMDVELARERGIFLELSSRRGHSLTNGHVAKTALKKGASLLINSDSHEPGDLLDADRIRMVGLGAGLDEKELSRVIAENPQALLRKREILERV